MKYIMARSGRSLTSSVSSNGAESKPETVLALFYGCGTEINKKSIKKIGKNNRGRGKFRYFVGVGKNREERKNI